MNVAEFKQWFDGFDCALDDSGDAEVFMSKAMWARLKEKVGELEKLPAPVMVRPRPIDLVCGSGQTGIAES